MEFPTPVMYCVTLEQTQCIVMYCVTSGGEAG